MIGDASMVTVGTSGDLGSFLLMPVTLVTLLVFRHGRWRLSAHRL